MQHDPEDEPAVSSLDPEYFEFDCKQPPLFHDRTAACLSDVTLPLFTLFTLVNQSQTKS